MQFKESMFRQVAKYESKGKISLIKPSCCKPLKYENRSKDSADHVKTNKNSRNKHDDSISSSDNDQNVTCRGEIFMLTIVKI
jgi:hypothetical protein